MVFKILAVLLIIVCCCHDFIVGELPEFTNDFKQFQLSEDIPIGSSVFELEVKPRADNSPIEFNIVADMFSVNSQTGVITLTRELDYDNGEVKLNIRITALATKTQEEAEIDVTVNVFDANDIPAKFSFTSYKAEVNENSLNGTIIFDNLYVEDPDGVNTANGISVKCDETRVDAVYRDSCTLFEVVRERYSTRDWAGKIVLRGKLDYESRPTLQILLDTFDGVNTYQQSFEVTILDVNDAPPYFIISQEATVSENIPNNTDVNRVVAIDGDKSNPRPIRYSLTCNNGGYFALDYETGGITNIKILNRENADLSQGFVVLCITASELISTGPDVLGNDDLTTVKTNVTINIQDENDNAPEFGQTSYDVSIPENIPNEAGLPGLIMTVSDKDSGTASYFDFKLLNHTNIFSIFPDKGRGQATASLKVINTALIDYEVGPRIYYLLVHAVESNTTNRRTGSVVVTVHITNINDNFPVFNPPNYNRTIFEDAVGGTDVVTVTATDEDSTNPSVKDIYFSLIGNGADKFEIGQTSGIIKVKACNTPGKEPCIDFESREEYQLTVMGRDNFGTGRQSTGRLIVTIADVNDNPPVFVSSPYVRYINEGQRVPTSDLVVSTSDRDTVGNPTYYSLSTNQSLWTIDTVTGRVTALQNIRYEDALNGTFSFAAIARNNDPVNPFPTAVNIQIIVLDINNYAPEFQPRQYTQIIDEDTGPGVSVITVTATDRDSPSSENGKFEFAIETGSQGKFSINRTSGLISTSSVATFDFDLQQNYTLLLLARDGGNPQYTGTATVTVLIRDKNNRLPYFKPTTQQFEVSEKTKDFVRVYQIQADDPDKDKKLRFSFQGPKSAITPTGNIVNINEYDYGSLFVIDGDTDYIITNNKTLLDRDRASVITYQMIVEDISQPGQSGTGTVIITILEYNDEAPVFDQDIYNITIDEELPIGTFIRTFVAQDKDGILSYRLIAPHQYFDIVSQTGVVSVNSRIDYEQIKYMEFRVEALDRGSPTKTGSTLVRVNIRNINDNSPEFLNTPYSIDIEERRGPSDTLMTVKAEDIDDGDFGEVEYRLNPGEARFSINKTTGEIKLLPNAELDRELENIVSLQVTAYDSPNTVNWQRVRREYTIPVYFRLLDVNDNSPVLTQRKYFATIIENTPINSEILPLLANDRDIGINAFMAFFKTTNTNDYFRVGRTSGVVIVDKDLLGKSGDYIFEVQVRDLDGRPGYLFDEATVTITVLEANNSPPKWIVPARENQTIDVLESQYKGMLVYDCHAEDEDTGPSSIINYGFLYGGRFTNETPEFHINRVTGVIHADIVYDREQIDQYLLQLIARDSGDPPLQAARFLTVKIKDVNDNQPTFPMADGVVLPYRFDLFENSTINQLIGTVTATDLDLEPYSDINYDILAGNEDNYFRLNSNNGEIRSNALIDRDALPQDTLSLYIKASNNVSDYSVIRNRKKRQTDPSIVEVQITVKDANDQVPYFMYPTGASEYHGCISLNAPYHRSVIQIQAQDKDVNGRTNLVYSIVSGNTNNMFAINSNTGMIWNRDFLNNFDERVYLLTVQVSDGRNTAQTLVKVFVTSSDNEERLVIKQRPSEVRLMTPQLIRTLSSIDGIDYVCVTNIKEHVLSDGKLSTTETDVYVTGIRSPSSGSGTDYTILSSESLNDDLAAAQAGDKAVEFNALYINSLGPESTRVLSVDRMPVLVVLIIVILLIVLAIILFCLACFCIRDAKRKKIKKYNAERGTIVHVQEEPINPVYDNPPVKSVNPVYDNPGFVAEPEEDIPQAEINEDPAVFRSEPDPEELYTAVQKPSTSSPDMDEEPVIETTIEPEDPSPELPRRPSPEPLEPVIETEVIDDEPVNHSPPPPVNEEEIDTVILDDSPESIRRVTPPIPDEPRTSL